VADSRHGIESNKDCFKETEDFFETGKKLFQAGLPVIFEDLKDPGWDVSCFSTELSNHPT